jgi:hypothetical protein
MSIMQASIVAGLGCLKPDRATAIMENQVIQVPQDRVDGNFHGNTGYMDDPFGTVKLWVG